MKKSKLKIFMISILCICCMLSSLLLTPTKNMETTSGVIIGPIVGLEDIVGYDGDENSPDYSNSNLSQDTPYTDGGLRSYRSIGVYNVVRDTGEWNGFKYASYIRYFKIVRTDGRPIYDDDGILDVSSDRTNLADEIVNYPSYIYALETTLPIKSGAGFMWTDQQAIFKSGELRCVFGYTSSNGTTSYVFDVPTDPSNQAQTLETIMNNSYGGNARIYDNLSITLDATGQYRNTFWGNTGGDTAISTNLTNYIAIGKRNWSNTLTASGTVKGSFKGKTAYYMSKPYTVIATNLNNYVKVNGVQATPQYGTSVAPYSDGHHISISDEGFTLVEIESGLENVYSKYYCFVDTTLPDINYTYHNSNAFDTRTVGNITVDTSGAKSQTTQGSIFKDEVQINFEYDENESPESATYTFNGRTYELTSGTWLKDEGDYIVTITDLAGNTSIHKFKIDKSSPNYNLRRLQNDTNYKVSKWYLVSVPYGYTNYGIYSYREQSIALNFACEAEKLNCVTNYYLTNISDFTATNLVANNNSVKLGDYWYYKSKDNPNLYVYYFDEDSLNEVVDYYASKYVSEEIYKINSTLSVNNYGNYIDESVYDNKIEDGYIANSFIFRQEDELESLKIYYDYQGDANESWVEFNYNAKFSDIVTTHGLYKIKEIDYVGHETTYYVFIDLNTPILDFEAVNYGSSNIITQSISKNDIPTNNELVFYYEKFKITNVVEDDNWWTLEIKCPNGSIKRFTKLDVLPNFEDISSGEFDVTIADRINTMFKFKVFLLGQAPQAKFETIGDNAQLKVSIVFGEQFNSVTDLKIYRNGVCLNCDNGYDEYPDRIDDELIYINPNTKKYTFGRGGIYVVELTDNFGRALSFEYKFEKNLPTGILSGVEHNGKTKEQVQFIFNSNKYFVVVNKNNEIFNPEQTTDKNITTLIFNPNDNAEDNYLIKIIDNTDTENYNSYSFVIKTIKPKIVLCGVKPNGKTGGDVYATWENKDEKYTANYYQNNVKSVYRKGQILSKEGKYKIILTDSIGNYSEVSFEIDKTIDFIIADTNQNQYKIDEIEFINFDIKFIANEPLSIKLLKDNHQINYDFNLMITDEGYYTVNIFDEFNNSVYFSFTIDKTPPIVELHGVENYGITNSRVWLASSETGLLSWYCKNSKESIDYKIGDEIIDSGEYVIYVSDKAKNTISFEFQIDNEVSFDINTYYGGISNGGVRIIAYEVLQIVMYKDDKPFDYYFEQILDEDGEYSFSLVDEFGNKVNYFFSIITKKKQSLKHILQENISVVSVLKDNEIFEVDITKNELYFYDEGIYLVEIFDGQKNENYNFEICIDTTPPTLELVGVENGGTTKRIVVLRNVSEKPYELYMTVDGVPFEYKIGDEIEKSGRFEVTLIDEAGNISNYSFERIYSLNVSSVAVLAGFGAMGVLVVIFIGRSRKRYDKDLVIEETEEVVTDEYTEN